MKQHNTGNYKTISRELTKLPVINITAQNLTREEVREIENTIRNLERKRSHRNKPRLLHSIRNIID